jgi:hypothetical protein
MADGDATGYGRAGTKAAALREAVHRLLIEHQDAGEVPTSNRFLFYELVQAGVLDKGKTRSQGRGADQDLSDASKWLRDEGLVPWAWIVDETRSLTEWAYADTVAEYVVASVDDARIDCWAGELAPLIVCESRTFGGVLRRTLAGAYLCPITATNGQVGGFLHTNVVPVLRGNDRPVLYVGDLDLAGGMIEANTQDVLVRASGDRDWQRVALTPEQVEANNLPVIVKEDRRFKLPRRHEAVEVEALGQGAVTALIRAALDEMLPVPLVVVQAREAEQRRQVRRELGES